MIVGREGRCHAVQGDSAAVAVPGGRLARGNSAISECVRLSAATPARSAASRFFGAHPVGPDARAWYAHALGELGVIDATSQLGSEWTALHAVDAGTDAPYATGPLHLIVGPPGVFVIVVLSGEPIWIGERAYGTSGSRVTILRDAEYAAVAVRRALWRATRRAVPVLPCVVATHPRGVTVATPPRGVHVLTVVELRRWLRSRSRVLSAEDVALVTRAARELESAAERDSFLKDVAAFRRVRAEFASAVHRRIIMVAAALAAAWLAALAVAASVFGVWSFSA